MSKFLRRPKRRRQPRWLVYGDVYAIACLMAIAFLIIWMMLNRWHG